MVGCTGKNFQFGAPAGHVCDNPLMNLEYHES